MRDHDDDETEVDPYADYRGQRVELGVLFDLQDHLRFAPREGMNSVLRGALMWAADQGWLAPVVVSLDQMDFGKVIAADLDRAEAVSQVDALKAQNSEITKENERLTQLWKVFQQEAQQYSHELMNAREEINDLQAKIARRDDLIETHKVRAEAQNELIAHLRAEVDRRQARQSAEGAANPSAASGVAIDAPEDATPVMRHAGPPEGDEAPSGGDDQIHEPLAVLPAEVAPPCDPVAPAAAEERPPAPAAAPVTEDRSGQPWTVEEEARAMTLRAQGATVREIAEILKRPVPGTGQKLKTLSHIAPVSAPGNALRPMWWREIEAELNALGYRDGWNAEADLMIVEAIVAGDDPQITADALGVEVSQMRARLIAMTPRCVDDKGRRKMTPEFQAQLLEVLRARAGKRDV